MDGRARADYRATHDDRSGPMPAGMQAVHVGRDHTAVVHEGIRGFRKIFILTNSSLGTAAAALQASVLASAAVGVECETCDAVKMGAGDDGVLAACAAAGAMKADCVVSLGGGAVQDAAKIVRLHLWACATHGAAAKQPSIDALTSAVAQLPTTRAADGPALLPTQIACPSVFAMAELTGMAGISSGGRKVGLSSPYMMPTVVCFDPALAAGAPDWLLYGTALRAVDHCVESVTSPHASSETQKLGLKGLRLVVRGLNGMLVDRFSSEAQQNVFIGGWNGILAMLNVGYAAGHFIENQLSAKWAVHQGACSALLMANVLRYHSTSHVSAAQQQRISSTLGFPAQPAAELIGDLAHRVIARAGMPRTLADVGATGEALQAFAAEVFEVHSQTLNNISPRPFQSSEDLLELLLLTVGRPQLVVVGGNYSYTANGERHGNDLHLAYSTACQHIADAGFGQTYLVPFRAADWPASTEQPDTGLAATPGLPFGSAALTPELLQQVRDSAERAGLDMHAVLVPSSGIDSNDPIRRYKRVIDQAVALGVSYLIDFGLHGDDSFDDYVAMMRAVAPYAQERGVAISMKLHSDGDADKILDNLVAIYDAVDHPAFGLCMDPGNIIFYSAPRETDKRYRLPTEGLAEAAHCFNSMIIKDCVIGPTPGEAAHPARSSNPKGTPDVMVQPGEGLVDFERVLSVLRQNAGFAGPLCLEKVPGRTESEVLANMRRAHAWMEALVVSTFAAAAAGTPASAAL